MLAGQGTLRQIVRGLFALIACSVRLAIAGITFCCECRVAIRETLLDCYGYSGPEREEI